MKQIKITLAFVVALIAIKAIASAETLRPQSTEQFRKSAVRVYNPSMTSGGSGSILISKKSGSTILTNKHVCALVEQGGIVEQDGTKYDVTAYKKFSDHDLCLIKIAENLNVNLKVSKTIAKPADTVYVSGHPSLLPHILTKGHLSSNMMIRLMVGRKPCKVPTPRCSFFGGEPVYKDLDSQVVSNLIQGGSSGSAVFNDDGEIVGVVFAGTATHFSYGFIVPQKYLIYFLSYSRYTPYVEVSNPEELPEKLESFDYKKCMKTYRMRKVCKRYKFDMIWRR